MKDIGLLAKKWAKEINRYDYLGELALTKNDYETHCELFRKQCVTKKDGESPTVVFSYCSVLVPLAINCAYFEYDEEGFWTHFLKRLGLSGHDELQGTIGKKIEDYLLEKQFIERRRIGSFRYVGAILEQTGITRRHLPRFVEFLKVATNRFGWSGLITLPSYLYDEILPDTGMSPYLVNFLKDDAGIEFIRSIARSLEQARYQQNQLEFLLSLKGYRPSFWAELLEYLAEDCITVSGSKEKINSIPLPRYLYQPTTNNRLAILFDIENVKLRKYRYDDEFVMEPSIQLLTASDIRDSYSVEVEPKNHQWYTIVVNGWLPDQQPYAFFDSDNGELLDVSQKVPLGKCYLVISTDYIAEQSDKHLQRFQDIIIGEYGWLDIRIATPLKGYLIEITPNTNLDFFGLKSDTTESRLMGWEKGKTLPEAMGFDKVFLGSVPDLILYQPELFERQDLLLHVDVEEGTPQIRMPDKKGHIKIPFSPPIKGVISVEPLGRQKAFYKYRNKQLSFCCIPSCQIIWPERLLAYDEKAPVRIESEGLITCSFPDNCTAKGDSTNEWELPPEQTFIEGLLSVNKDEITVPIVKHLPRAAMLDSRMTPIDTISVQQLLDEKTFYLTGYSGSQAKLFLCVSGKYNKLLADLGNFDQAGKIQFSSAAIKDSLRNLEITVGTIGVGYYGDVVLSGTRLYDTKKMEYQLCQEASFGEDWIEYTASRHRLSLDIVRNLICDRIPSTSFEICEDLPHEMKAWGEEVLYCAKILDKKRIDGKISPSFLKENEQLVSALKIITNVQSLHSPSRNEVCKNAQLELFVEEIERITWRPRVKRWRIVFEEYISRVRADLDILGELLKWKEEVLKPGILPEYNSMIAQMPQGRELTNAWKKYLTGADKRAYGRCDAILSDFACCSPISDLARVLKNILLHKRGMKDGIAMVRFDCHSKLLALVEKSFSLGEDLSSCRETEITGRKYLPLKDSDKSLFK